MKQGSGIWGIVFACLLFLQASVATRADDPFIHPGDPQVKPNDDVTPVSFDRLIPTTYPILVPDPPTVHPTDSLVQSTAAPMVPTGAR